MCGINGLVGFNSADSVSLMKPMNKAIAHRGPDDEGVYLADNLALGHRRLSIIDLSSEGHQPMFSHNGRFVIVFNGEIYNFREVKKEILAQEPAFQFFSQTDTEVLLKAFELWGIDCLHKLNGMFAFALFDTFNKKLYLVRDRLGIKPVYYAINNGKFAFSSELRAVLSTGIVERKIAPDALVDYLKYQTVHAPNTIIEGVKMLMPGHYMVIDTTQPIEHPEVKQFWNISQRINYSSDSKTYEEVKKDIYNLLYKSVERRLIADVPFGAFLSGGIDSSAVVGLMSRISQTPVKTFSVTFDESEFSEAKYAKMIADKFGTEHQEIRLSPSDFRNQLPDALKAMDHPSGDGPNTYLVSKVTKEAGVTMALSGLGGDELFAGYDVFTRSLELTKKQNLLNVPKPLRKLAGGILAAVKRDVRSRKLNELLALDSFDIKYTYPLSRRVLLDKEVNDLLNIPVTDKHTFGFIDLDKEHRLSAVSLAEIGSYMQNVLLRDTDQMSMASALEVRVPFMDYELVEYVLGVPDRYKYPHTPKKLLIDSLGELLPPEVINRPKMGFTFPWQQWMTNELKNFCEVRMVSLSKRPYFNSKAVLEQWYRFLNDDNRVTWSRIWFLVVLENWLTENNVQ